MMIDIVFDGPPGNESGRFIEVESTDTRKSIRVGEWLQRDDGHWVLRIDIAPQAKAEEAARCEVIFSCEGQVHAPCQSRAVGQTKRCNAHQKSPPVIYISTLDEI